MSESKFRGIVHFIDETKTFGQKGFRKRLVVLEHDNGRFVNYVPFDFLGDQCDAADSLAVGDEIEINFRLSGRKWQRDPQSEVKYFLNAEATGFKSISTTQSPGAAPAPAANPNDDFADAAYDGEDVPF